ncbi:hypothetical protein V6Z98_004651 [Aspergillus fumigatus]
MINHDLTRICLCNGADVSLRNELVNSEKGDLGMELCCLYFRFGSTVPVTRSLGHCGTVYGVVLSKPMPATPF